MEKHKRQYEMFLASGDFEDLFPTLTGEWEQDEEEFILLQESLPDADNKYYNIETIYEEIDPDLYEG